MLCGHTHGGQIRLPAVGAVFTQPRVSRRYAWGLARKHDTLIYTTCGIGWALAPIRFNCPPEVVHITLHRGAGPHDRGEPEGGKYRLLISGEYRYPLSANSLYLVAFCDAGTVTSDFSGFGTPRLAVGLGFRLYLPRLSRAPISLDFGVPLLKDSDDETELIFFSLSFDR